MTDEMAGNKEIKGPLHEGAVMGEITETDSTREQQNANAEDEIRKAEELVKKEEEWLNADRVRCLLFAAAAWLYGKLHDRLFEPSEPHTWWVWTKRLYALAIAVYTAIHLWRYQKYLSTRDALKRRAAEPTPEQKPTEDGQVSPKPTAVAAETGKRPGPPSNSATTDDQ
jgi:hypothetical protein